MKLIPLTQGCVALVDDSDYERVMAAGPWFALDRGHTVYAIRNSRGDAPRLMHRFVLGLTDPKQKIDHRNGYGFDNRRSNLRFATSSQNNTNRRKKEGTTSKYTGVTRTRSGKWQVQKKFNGQVLYLGVYDDEETAARVYDAAAKWKFGEFARLNFPKKKR